jgi:hypothetical protein
VPRTLCPAPPRRAATAPRCPAPPRRRRGRPPPRRRARRRRATATGSCASSGPGRRHGRRRCGKAAAFRRRRTGGCPRWPWRPPPPDLGASSSVGIGGLLFASASAALARREREEGWDGNGERERDVCATARLSGGCREERESSPPISVPNIVHAFGSGNYIKPITQIMLLLHFPFSSTTDAREEHCRHGLLTVTPDLTSFSAWPHVHMSSLLLFFLCDRQVWRTTIRNVLCLIFSAERMCCPSDCNKREGAHRFHLL